MLDEIDKFSSVVALKKHFTCALQRGGVKGDETKVGGISKGEEEEGRG